MKQARKFLIEGDKVKVTVMFRGREMVHREHGYKQLDRVKEIVGPLASTESTPRMEGRFLSMILVGNREEIAKLKKVEAQAAKAGAAEAETEERRRRRRAEPPSRKPRRRMRCRR